MSTQNIEWLTTADLAKYLSKTEGAIRVMVHRKQLTGKKINGRLYFNKLEISDMIENSPTVGMKEDHSDGNANKV